MTVERYDTPNHPRWNPRAEAATRAIAASRRRYGRARRYGRRGGGRQHSDPPLLIARDVAEDDPTIDLRDTPEGVWITAELPDRSLGDVRVTANGASLRIRAEPSDGSSQPDRLDRRIELARPIDPDDIVVAYDEPALAVVIFDGGG